MNFQLDHDRKGVMMEGESNPHDKRTWWTVTRPKVWTFMSNPHSSIWANVFGYISLLIVVLSIFSFVADTTEGFAVYTTRPGSEHGGGRNYTSAGNSSHLFGNGTIDTTTAAAVGPNTTSGFDATSVASKPEVVFGPTETEDTELFRVTHPSLQLIDTICLIFFTIEYVLHLAFAPNKLKYSTSIMGVIDVVAILPDYMELIVFAIRPDLIYVSDARNIMAMLHLARVLRIFRLIRHVPGLWIFIYTFKASIGELVLLGCFMLLGILLFSSLIYYAEGRKNIESIPHAFWWAIITMTTVGYGDMYPVTTAGKLIGSTCAMSGLLMIGFSVPALVNNFMLFYKHVQYALQAEREMEKEKKDSHTTSVSNGHAHTENGHNGDENDTLECDSNGNENTEMSLLSNSSIETEMETV